MLLLLSYLLLGILLTKRKGERLFEDTRRNRGICKQCKNKFSSFFHPSLTYIRYSATGCNGMRAVPDIAFAGWGMDLIRR
jgi:hypothetical protein